MSAELLGGGIGNGCNFTHAPRGSLPAEATRPGSPAARPWRSPPGRRVWGPTGAHPSAPFRHSSRDGLDITGKKDRVTPGKITDRPTPYLNHPGPIPAQKHGGTWLLGQGGPHLGSTGLTATALTRISRSWSPGLGSGSSRGFTRQGGRCWAGRGWRRGRAWRGVGVPPILGPVAGGAVIVELLNGHGQSRPLRDARITKRSGFDGFFFVADTNA